VKQSHIFQYRFQKDSSNEGGNKPLGSMKVGNFEIAKGLLAYEERIRYIVLFFRVKVKFSLEQAMKAQRGSRGIALLFL
jgi:hypothetical protein